MDLEVELEMQTKAEAIDQGLSSSPIWVSMRSVQSIMEMSEERVTGALIFTETSANYLSYGESIANTKKNTDFVEP